MAGFLPALVCVTQLVQSLPANCMAVAPAGPRQLFRGHLLVGGPNCKLCAGEVGGGHRAGGTGLIAIGSHQPLEASPERCEFVFDVFHRVIAYSKSP